MMASCMGTAAILRMAAIFASEAPLFIAGTKSCA